MDSLYPPNNPTQGFTKEINQEVKVHEKEFFMDGNFDYYSKSRSKKYRGSKYRMTAE